MPLFSNLVVGGGPSVSSRSGGILLSTLTLALPMALFGKSLPEAASLVILLEGQLLLSHELFLIEAIGECVRENIAVVIAGTLGAVGDVGAVSRAGPVCVRTHG